MTIILRSRACCFTFRRFLASRPEKNCTALVQQTYRACKNDPHEQRKAGVEQRVYLDIIVFSIAPRPEVRHRMQILTSNHGPGLQITAGSSSQVTVGCRSEGAAGHKLRFQVIFRRSHAWAQVAGHRPQAVCSMSQVAQKEKKQIKTEENKTKERER